VAFPSRLLNDDEHVVVHTREHPKALILPVLVLVLSLAAGVAAQSLLGGSVGSVTSVAVWVVAGVVVLWWVVRPLVRWATSTYTFTNRRFIARSGFIAKSGRTIPLNRISGVDFEIGVVDRAFGCGTLVVSDASEEGRVELHDIPHVEEVQLRVADELHRLSGRRGSDDGT